jgi:hypothetical protein
MFFVMQPVAAAKGYEKNAWVLVAIISAVGIITALLQIAGMSGLGLPALSGYSLYLAQTGGLSLLGYGITGMGISMTAYKRGEKWAWYVIWYLPIYFMIYAVADDLQGGSEWPVALILMLITLAALLLPYRIFFPKK